jgi:zinc transporter ZupT
MYSLITFYPFQFIRSDSFISIQRAFLDASLGFASGVMLAASYWSLLAPAIEMSAQSGTYGAEGEWAFVPVAVGFLLGAVFVYAADVLMSHLGVRSPVALRMHEIGQTFVHCSVHNRSFQFWRTTNRLVLLLASKRDAPR